MSAYLTDQLLIEHQAAARRIGLPTEVMAEFNNLALEVAP